MVEVLSGQYSYLPRLCDILGPSVGTGSRAARGGNLPDLNRVDVPASNEELAAPVSELRVAHAHRDLAQSRPIGTDQVQAGTEHQVPTVG